MRYKIRFLPYNTDAWITIITIRHFLYLLFICATYFSMIVHVPKVSHHTFRICTPYIVHTTYHHNILLWYQLLYLLISWPLVPIRPCISKILQVTPKALPKFNWRTQLMTSLIPQFFWLRRRRCQNSTGNPINDNLIQIRPRTITIHRVTPEALPKFNM